VWVAGDDVLISVLRGNILRTGEALADGSP
jgi:hypothetical protein